MCYQLSKNHETCIFNIHSNHSLKGDVMEQRWYLKWLQSGFVSTIQLGDLGLGRGGCWVVTDKCVVWFLVTYLLFFLNMTDEMAEVVVRLCFRIF